MFFRFLIIICTVCFIGSGNLQAALMHSFDFNSGPQGWTVTTGNAANTAKTSWDPNLQCLNVAGNDPGPADQFLSPRLAVTNGAKYTIVFDYTTNTALSQVAVHFFNTNGEYLSSIQVPTNYLAATHSDYSYSFAWQRKYHTFTASVSGQTVGSIQISAANFSGWGRAQFDNIELHSGTYIPAANTILCSYDFSSNTQGWTVTVGNAGNAEKTCWDPNMQCLKAGSSPTYAGTDYFLSPMFVVADGAQYTVAFDYDTITSLSQFSLVYFDTAGNWVDTKEIPVDNGYLTATHSDYSYTYAWQRKFQTFTASVSGKTIGFVQIKVANYSGWGRARFDNIEIRSGNYTPAARTVLGSFDFNTGAQGWQPVGASYDLYWNSAMKCLDTWWADSSTDHRYHQSPWFKVTDGATYTAVMDYTTVSSWAHVILDFYGPNGEYRGNLAIPGGSSNYVQPTNNDGDYFSLWKTVSRTFTANLGTGTVGFVAMRLYNDSSSGRTQFDNIAVYSGTYVPAANSIIAKAGFGYDPFDSLADKTGSLKFDWTTGKDPAESSVSMPVWETDGGSDVFGGCLALDHSGTENAMTWWLTQRIPVTDGATYSLFYDYSTDAQGSYASIHYYDTAGAWIGQQADYEYMAWDWAPSLNPTGLSTWKSHSKVFVPHVDGQTVGFVQIAFYHRAAYGHTRFDNFSIKKGSLYAAADFDKNDAVNSVDLSYFTQGWLVTNPGCSAIDKDPRDINADCTVNFKDFAALAASWMQSTTF